MDQIKEDAKNSVVHILDQICDKMAIDRVTLYVLIEEIMEDEGFIETESTKERLH